MVSEESNTSVVRLEILGWNDNTTPMSLHKLFDHPHANRRRPEIPQKFALAAPIAARAHTASSRPLLRCRQDEPNGQELLSDLCGEVEGHWIDALNAGICSLSLREALWDGVLARLEPASS